jgi:hypothetical protein
VGEQVVVLAAERVALLEEEYGYARHLNRALIEP